MVRLALNGSIAATKFFSRSLPIERIKGTRYAHFVAHSLERAIPTGRERSCGPGIPDRMRRNAQSATDDICGQRIGDVVNGGFCHTPEYANWFSNGQAKHALSRQSNWLANITSMDSEKIRPFSDIAERLKWHREQIVGATQAEYAASIGVKRAAYSLWEAGTHRLSLDGSLALRSKYGLSMDFMHEGIDDALPMTLRNAWRDRS